jgi:perosamine synthetase
MSSVLLPEHLDRGAVAKALAAEGVDTRPFVYPVHTLPPYTETAAAGSFPVAEQLSAGGLNLPTSALLLREDVEYVCEALHAAVAARV